MFKFTEASPNTKPAAPVGSQTPKSSQRRLYFFITSPLALIPEVTRTVAPERFTVMAEDTVQNCLVYGGNVSCLFRCRRRERGSRSEVNSLGDYLETSTVINYAKLPARWEPRSRSARRRRLLLDWMRFTMSPRCLGPCVDYTRASEYTFSD